MDIYINGQQESYPLVSESLLKLLETKQITLASAGVAVALNDELKPKSSWEKTVVVNGDRIEIVNAIQGG